MKVQCCVCQKVRSGERWRTPRAGEITGDHISHGYCPKCAAKAFEQIRRSRPYGFKPWTRRAI